MEPPVDFQTTILQNLLKRMENGDPQAREELLVRTWDRVERLCRKMLGHFPTVRRWEQTGDVLHNALLRLMASLEELKPTTTREFFALAAEQIRRELIDLHRYYSAQRRRPEGGVSSLPPPDESRGQALEPSAERDEADELDRWGALHEAVSQLPVEEREVFGLIFYNGWKQQEIATLFQVHERTIRRYWQAACLHLRDLLGGELPSF